MINGGQARILNPRQIELILNHLDQSRQPERNKVIFLLSVKAGLRAKEIASLKWSMLVNDENLIGSELHLPHSASKGKSGRNIPLNKQLKKQLEGFYNIVRTKRNFHPSDSYVITTDRSLQTSPQVIVNMFRRWYTDLGMIGCSSHSGRRTFITNTARRITTVGGSLRDIQALAGHNSLQTTQRYIEAHSDARKRVVDLI